MRDPIRFTRIVPSLDTTSAQVARLLTRLSTPDAPRPLVFETWATEDGITHLVGRTDASRPVVRSLLTAHLPDLALVRARRPDTPERGARLRATPRSLPLANSEVALEQTLHAHYTVFAGRRKHETIAVQFVLGRGRRPVQVPTKITDPAASIGQLLLRGAGVAPSETRGRIAEHAAEPRIDITVRIGVTAAVPERRRQIRGQLRGAFARLEAPGTQVSLVSESPVKWQHAVTSRAAVPLTATQAVPLLGWPLDDLRGVELPGLPPRHPRQLPPPEGVSGSGAVFAETTASGRERPIGLDPASRLQHLAITGGTGSGKSEIFATLALADIAARIPLILIEPKRQLVDAIIARAPGEEPVGWC